jgi:hypothetical protein
MITIVVCILIVVAFGVIGYRWDKEEKKKTIRFVTLLVGATIGFLIALGFFIVIGVMSRTTEGISDIETEKATLVSLTGATEVKGDIGGNIFVFTGTVDSQDLYKFYYRAQDGAKIFMKLPKENVRVYEEDRQDAYITKIVKVKILSKSRMWTPTPWSRTESYDEFQYYAIHVPLGTIKPEIDMSLK